MDDIVTEEEKKSKGGRIRETVKFPYFVLAFSIILTVGIGEKRVKAEDFALLTRRGDTRLKY